MFMLSVLMTRSVLKLNRWGKKRQAMKTQGCHLVDILGKYSGENGTAAAELSSFSKATLFTQVYPLYSEVRLYRTLMGVWMRYGKIDSWHFQ